MTATALRPELATTDATAFTFSVPRSALAEALGRVIASTKQGKLLPILQAVLIEAADGALTFSTTDLERWVVTRVPVTTMTGRGKVALQADRLAKVVASLPTGIPITVDVKGARAKLAAGRAKFELVGLPVDEWPKATTFVSTLSVTVDGRAFAGALSRVSGHVGDEKRETALRGAYFEATAEGIALVCCDGPSIARGVVTSDPMAALGIVIPREAFGLIGRLFGDDETVAIDANESQCRITGSRSTLATRLVNETFPPYRAILKLAPKLTVTTLRDELMQAVDRVTLVAEHGRIFLRFSDEGVTLDAHSTDAGQAEDFVEGARVVHEAGSIRRIAVMGDRLKLCLKSIPGKSVSLGITGELSPLYVFEPIEGATPPSLNVGLSNVSAVLPLRYSGPVPNDQATSNEREPTP